jgi:hypothetical protein
MSTKSKKRLAGCYYFASILMLFLGLSLFQSSGVQSLSHLVGLYLVQIFYEIIMFFMGINLVNRMKTEKHGLLLLVLGLLLSGDITFFQYHISSHAALTEQAFVSIATVGLYLTWTVSKVYILITKVDVNFNKWLWAPYLTSIAFIHIAPIAFMNRFEISCFISKTFSANTFCWEIWLCWIFACVLLIPVLSGKTESEEAIFSWQHAHSMERVISCFMWALVPVHLLFVLHSDSILGTDTHSRFYALTPYLLLSLFVYKRYFVWEFENESNRWLAEFIPVALIQVILMNIPIKPEIFGETGGFHPINLNLIGIYATHLYLAYQGNVICGGYAALSTAYCFRQVPGQILNYIYLQVSKLSRTSISYLAIGASFLLLAVGYFVSNQDETA